MSNDESHRQVIAERYRRIHQQPILSYDDLKEILGVVGTINDRTSLSSYRKHLVLLASTIHLIRPFWKYVYKEDTILQAYIQAIIVIARKGHSNQNDVAFIVRLEIDLHTMRSHYSFGWLVFLAVSSLNSIILFFARDTYIDSEWLIEKSLSVIHFVALAYTTMREDSLLSSDSNDDYAAFLRLWLVHIVPFFVPEVPSPYDSETT